MEVQPHLGGLLWRRSKEKALLERGNFGSYLTRTTFLGLFTSESPRRALNQNYSSSHSSLTPPLPPNLGTTGISTFPKKRRVLGGWEHLCPVILSPGTAKQSFHTEQSKTQREIEKYLTIKRAKQENLAAPPFGCGCSRAQPLEGNVRSGKKELNPLQLELCLLSKTSGFSDKTYLVILKLGIGKKGKATEEGAIVRAFYFRIFFFKVEKEKGFVLAPVPPVPRAHLTASVQSHPQAVPRLSHKIPPGLETDPPSARNATK